MKIRSGAGGGSGRKPAATSPEPELKTLIHDHSLFFDRLIDLIPARFYLPPPDADDRTPYPFLPKPAKAAAREESRQNLKKARRIRLDPDNSLTTLDLLHKSIQATKIADANADDDNDDGDAEKPAQTDRVATYEELQQRLHNRIQECRSTRNTRPTNKFIHERRTDRRQKKSERKESIKIQKQKRKREDADSENTREDKKAKITKSRPVDVDAADPKDMTFGQVKIGGEDDKGRRKKKLSKEQELERAKRLEAAKNDPEKGERVVKKHSWKSAVDRAAGVKVHDDPKLLKESIKKEKKRRQKHAEQWKERIQGRNKEKGEKQRTRTENIKGRIQQKKTRRIEKREKKLMRPGFEGRKGGYINE